MVLLETWKGRNYQKKVIQYIKMPAKKQRVSGLQKPVSSPNKKNKAAKPLPKKKK